MSAEFDSILMDNTIYLFAYGENQTSGWNNYFQKSPLTINPPQYAFIQEPPDGISLQVITPFKAIETIRYEGEAPTEVIVRDSQGEHKVAIRTSPTIAESALIESTISTRFFLPGNEKLYLKKTVQSSYYERPLGSFDDWLSQHCSTKCVRVEQIGRIPIKVCTAYRTVCQHIRVHAVLVVSVATDQDIAGAVENALEKATIAGMFAALLGAFASGGVAAAEAAKNTFVALLTAELAQSLRNLIKVDIDYRRQWV